MLRSKFFLTNILERQQIFSYIIWSIYKSLLWNVNQFRSCYIIWDFSKKIFIYYIKPTIIFVNIAVQWCTGETYFITILHYKIFVDLTCFFYWYVYIIRNYLLNNSLAVHFILISLKNISEILSKRKKKHLEFKILECNCSFIIDRRCIRKNEDFK